MPDKKITWPKPHVRIDPGKEQEAAAWLKEQYEKGAYIRDLAERIGRSYGFVHRMLREAGVTFRPRGGARRRRPGSDGAKEAARTPDGRSDRPPTAGSREPPTQHLKDEG